MHLDKHLSVYTMFACCLCSNVLCENLSTCADGEGALHRHSFCEAWQLQFTLCLDNLFQPERPRLLRAYVPAGGEAGPSNIEESKADRKRSKSSGVPSRPLPVSVCKDVIMSLAKQQGWKGWAFDGRKNIYTSTALMDTHQEHKFQVCFGRLTCANATRGPHFPAMELLTLARTYRVRQVLLPGPAIPQRSGLSHHVYITGCCTWSWCTFCLLYCSVHVQPHSRL